MHLIDQIPKSFSWIHYELLALMVLKHWNNWTLNSFNANWCNGCVSGPGTSIDSWTWRGNSFIQLLFVLVLQRAYHHGYVHGVGAYEEARTQQWDGNGLFYITLNFQYKALLIPIYVSYTFVSSYELILK